MSNEEKVSKPREYHSKSIRLIKLENALQKNRYMSVDDLCDELEVSRRTVLRDIQNLMNDFNAPIEYDRLHKGYHYTDETFMVKNVLVSEGELVAITSILPLLERYNNTPLKDTISKIYDTIASMLPNQVEVQTSLLNDVQFIADAIPVIEEEVFSAIFKAIRLHETIIFDYRSISSIEYKPHSMNPYKIYCQKGDWYVVGYCHNHKNFSTYTLARMKNVTPTTKFEPDPEYDKKVHIDPNFGIWNNDNPPQKIELLFDKSINTYILERTWHKNQECHQNEDGSVYLSFTSNQDQETLYWVMKFGSKVKVLNPPSLRDKVIEELKNALNNYSKNE